MRRPRLLPALVCALCAAAITSAPAYAQGGSTSPFSPGLPQAPATTSTPARTNPILTNPTTTTSSGGSGLSSSSTAAIAIGAIIVLGGISVFIWRDARRRAPVRHRAAAATAGPERAHPGSKARPKPRKPSPVERRRRKRGRAR